MLPRQVAAEKVSGLSLLVPGLGLGLGFGIGLGLGLGLGLGG